MKKIIAVSLILCCLLSGCASGGGNVDTGDINVGDIMTGDTDAGDINAGEMDSGLYVKIESDAVASVEWRCGEASGSLDAPEPGTFLLLSTEIADLAEAEGKPAGYTVTAKTKDGEIFARGEFTCPKDAARVELIVTRDGAIRE